MNRRASLPGVDALFGTAGAGDRRAAEGVADAPNRPNLQAAVPESDTLRGVRDRLPTDAPVPDATITTVLGWVAATCRARTVVEVGSASGITGTALLEILPARGVLTSIEPDGHTHGLAAEAFREAGAGSRVRSIQGNPDEVLPRLTDGGYDLIIWQIPIADADVTLAHVRRLLREGGILLARGLLVTGGGRTQAEAFVTDLLEDERFSLAILPLDGGVVLATRRDPA